MKQTIIKGNENKVFDTVSEYLIITENATALIKGNVRFNSIIWTNQNAQVTVQGVVDEGARFRICGKSSITFNNRPPESVLQSIDCQNTATVIVPGGFTNKNHNNNNNNNNTNSSRLDYLKAASNAVPTVDPNREKVFVSADDGLITITRDGISSIYEGKKSSVIGNRVYIDGKEVTADDPRFISSSEEAEQTPVAKPALTTPARLTQQFQHLPSSSTTTTTTSSSFAIESTENKYAPYFNTYLKSFENQPTLADKINALGKLTPEEELLFEKFRDCIFDEYMQIPVQLHEQWFDFKTLKGQTRDPNHNVSFHPFELQTGRELIKDAEALIEQVKTNRAQASQSNDNNVSEEKRTSPALTR